MCIKRSDYRPPAYLIDHVDLHFEVDEATTHVRCRLEVGRNPDSDETSQPLFLDGTGLELHTVALNGTPLPRSRFRHDFEGLTVPRVPDRFTLETSVSIHPDQNADLMGLYAADGILCTQCEPEAFRRITFFPDRPDVLATFSVTMTADRKRYPVLLSNGNPIQSRDLADGRHRVLWEDPHPKPSYLFALVAGRLESLEDQYVTGSGRKVRLKLYTEPGESERGAHALSSVKRAMAWDESRYGREYDLDVFNMVAISQYTMGAMENKGLNIFNDRYVLADPGISTDRNYRDIDALVAHEYFHNWSGNRVTCRDWFQLSLKEGFTVLREQQYVADHGWRAVRRIEDVRLMKERQFTEDTGPLSHPVRPESYLEIENFYTDTVYSKGAELLRMLSVMVGSDRFREASDLFFTRHDGQAVTVEDFLQCVSDVADADLEQFSQWYELPGTPTLEVFERHDGDRGIYELTIEQHRDGQPSDLHMPVAVGFLDERGRELSFRFEDDDVERTGTCVLDMHAPVQHFRFLGLRSRPVPALLRDFSAPVEVHFEQPTPHLATLVRHDPDVFVRWDALQRLVAGCLCDPGQGIEDGGAWRALEECIAGILSDSAHDPALSSLLLDLPEVTTLAGLMDQPDLEAIHQAREKLRVHLSDSLFERFSDVYRALDAGGPYRRDPAEIGRRALRNACLSFLAARGDEKARDLCLAHYRQAENMTDRLAALKLLAEQGGGQREEVLSDFHRRWGSEPLAMDKWFSAQARSGGRDGLRRVRALIRHPQFSFDKPNRVRSVIETFCTHNSLGFNHPDGSGYRFLADCVRRLDPVNPPLAAGLLRHMVNWKGCSRTLRELRMSELDRLKKTPELSRQSWEIISTALDGATENPGV